MSVHDWLVLWRDACRALIWVVVFIFMVSGGQDLIYDVWVYGWVLYRKIRFARRERLSLERMRMREQQRIAVMVPAWNEGDVIFTMVANILQRVEYRNYWIFVGTYPNDPPTQQAVDAVAAEHPEVIKVVTTNPGPTSKADCLNHINQAILAFEEANGFQFDMYVMHDAEDVVHPYSFLLFNYLIPRVDIIQLPILPLPTSHKNWTHWVYADEFVENHMKDVPVREKMGGFVPYAGVGTAFSRRAINMLELWSGQQIFNEESMTEDYSMSRRTRLAGLKSVFVNVILKDDTAGLFTPLCKRSAFVANWAYFPMDFQRSVRQKTRWIIGISLQEWEMSGWRGSWVIKENLIKDRKVFITATTNLLGYFIFIYYLLSELGNRHYLPFTWLSIVDKGTLLYTLVVVATSLMFLRLFQRFFFVSEVYGLVAGLLSAPRMFYANIINAYAAFRALRTFSTVRMGRGKIRWEKTVHLEGVGELPMSVAEFKEIARPARIFDRNYHLAQLRAPDPARVIAALEVIPRDLAAADRHQVVALMTELGRSRNGHIRAVVARVGGYLAWPELGPVVGRLLYDREWVVRANAARALLKLPNFEELTLPIFQHHDRYAWDILIRTIEHSDRAQQRFIPLLLLPQMQSVREIILGRSMVLRYHYDRYMGIAPELPAEQQQVFGLRPFGESAAAGGAS